MSNLYEQVVELLGNRQSEESFQRLIHAIGEEPTIYLDTKHSTEYFFYKSGIALSYMKVAESFCHAHFHFETQMVKSGAVSIYNAELPNGIRYSDDPGAVEAKMGRSPISAELVQGRTEKSVKTLWLRFQVKALTVNFGFSDDRKRLALVSLQYHAE